MPEPVNWRFPEEEIPVAAATAPEELTWNASPLPTVNSDVGVVSPIPTLPVARIRMRSVPLVSNAKALASLVPSVASEPKALPSNT